MPRYRVLRDFGSHLGNHTKGEHLTLPDGALPRGFTGLVEALPDPKPAPKPVTVELPDGLTAEQQAAARKGVREILDAAHETKDVVPASRRASVAPADAGPDDPPADEQPIPPVADAPAGSRDGDKSHTPPAYADKMITSERASKRVQP